MTTILRIDASARRERSLTRALADRFERQWLGLAPGTRFIHRDLARTPPPLVSETWIAAAFTPPESRTAAQNAVLRPSDELIDELEAADLIVLATPMYNYGMPAALKAWFDQVIRIGRTFSFDLDRGDWPLRPMLPGKTLVVLTSRGEFGFLPGGIREDKNHLDPHIVTCAPYLGVDKRHLIAIEYQEFGDERHAQSVAAAQQAVRELVEELAGLPAREATVA